MNAAQTSLHERSAGDHGPQSTGSEDAQFAELIELDQTERSRLERLVRDPVRRDLIVDRAIEVMLRRLLQGEFPNSPKAWLRRVVDRLIRSRKIPFAPEQMGLDEVAGIAWKPESARAREAGRHAQAAWLREKTKKIALTEREREILGAALDHSSNRAAAKALGMSTWNLSRALESLGRKIRRAGSIRNGENLPTPEAPPPS